jgi:hypothetical protein
MKLDRDVAEMRMLRRLLSHFSHLLGMTAEETSISAVLSTLDYFDKYPVKYKELFRDSI